MSVTQVIEKEFISSVKLQTKIHMRVAYVLHWNMGPESGVFKKVLDQVRAWVGYGCDVKIFMLSRGACAELNKTHDGVPILTRAYCGLTDRLSQLKQLVKDVIKWNPDLVYHRYELYYPELYSLACQIPMVLEINTDDVGEYRLSSRLRNLYNRLTRVWLLKQAGGIVFVTTELSQKPYFARYYQEGAVIGNSIDLSRFPLLPPVTNPRPRLVFIGSSGQPWHGVDKIIWLANRFPSWQFDLIGISPADLTVIPPNNLMAHGFLDRTRYEALIAKADVAIGSLSLHRNGMEEGSPLKVREYLAFGIPIIIAYKDVDFPGENPYILKLPNTPDNIITHTEIIEKFVNHVKGTRVPRDMINHLDIQYKELRRLMFMRTIIERFGQRDKENK